MIFSFTPLDILFIVLAIAVFLVTIFLCMALYHSIQIMRGVEHVVDKAQETVDQVNEYISKPISVMIEVIERVRQMMGIIEDKQEKKHKK